MTLKNTTPHCYNMTSITAVSPRAGPVMPTCDQALAGISGRHGMDAVRRVRDLVSAIFDGDGVASGHVWHVGHRVRPVSVVTDVGLLRLAIRVLRSNTHTHINTHTHVCEFTGVGSALSVD